VVLSSLTVRQMARMVATKAALSIRFDALTNADEKSEPTATTIGTDNRAKLESRLRALEHQSEGGVVRRFADNGKKQQPFQMKGETKTYNTQADHVDLVSTQRDDPMEAAVKIVLDVKEEKRREKEERRAKRRAEKEKSSNPDGDDGDMMEVDGIDMEEKKKKRKRRESGQETEDVVMEETPEEPKASLLFLFKISDFMLNIFVSSGNRRGEKSKKKSS
jgi:nucleolar protein 58